MRLGNVNDKQFTPEQAALVEIECRKADAWHEEQIEEGGITMTILERDTLIQDTKTPIFNAIFEMACEALEMWNSCYNESVDRTESAYLREHYNREANRQAIKLDTIARCVSVSGLMPYEEFNTLVHDKVEEENK